MSFPTLESSLMGNLGFCFDFFFDSQSDSMSTAKVAKDFYISREMCCFGLSKKPQNTTLLRDLGHTMGSRCTLLLNLKVIIMMIKATILFLILYS